VLWNGGISFGGVIAFIFADLIIVPIINIYRKYYGGRMAALITATFGVAMVLAAYAVEAFFGVIGLVPETRDAKVTDVEITWDYTTYLNIMFLLVAAALVLRFVRTDGIPMLRMMGGSPDDMAHHDHCGHEGAESVSSEDPEPRQHH